LVLVMSGVSSATAQSLPLGTPVLEDLYRIMQLKGERDSSTSFLIRPLHAGENNEFDSLYYPYGLQYKRSSGSRGHFLKDKGAFYALPLTINQQYNTHHPYGWNDGAMIPAKGYQALFSAGIYASVGWLSVQLRPEFVFAENRDFAGFPTEHTDSVWKQYYGFLNSIDNPEQFGKGAYTKFFPGQSSVRLNYKKLSLGYSTENLWWGPGIRNSLVMSNNAPGFGHFTFNTTAPVKTFVGHLEWQLIAGTLKNSGILPPDTSRTFEGTPLYVPKNNSDRYINALVLTWQPKWVKGLFLGFSRSFYQYSDNVPKNLYGYLPVFSSLFKGGQKDDASIGRDQMLSLFFRWVLQKEQAEVYAEFGRNDHSQNATDLALEPEHSRAYIFGFRKLIKNAKNRDVELMMEFSNLQAPSTSQLRDLQPWYVHYQTRHGYTNRGQVLGAGIGPGGNSQTIGISWIRDIRRFGVFLERVTRNNDFYYQAFGPMRNYDSHWVDLSLNATKSWQYKQLLLKADLSFIRSLNYQWRYEENPATLLNGKKNVNNMHAGFSVSYIF
ncbi:MAG TPA: capsule assembly Wzi family protein, partial [Chitinophagaceae bacterium]|nr:capsule assembly Wzi family protein [Chitinophagaceae bacterium]